MSQQPKHHGSIPKGMHKTKPKEFKKTLLRLARYLKPRTFQLVLVVFAAILATLFNVISPKLLGTRPLPFSQALQKAPVFNSAFSAGSR